MSGKMLETLRSLLEDNGIDMEMLKEPFSENTKLREDLGLDGDNLIDFVMDVEEKYDISIDDEIAEKAKTIADLINIINSNFE